MNERIDDLESTVTKLVEESNQNQIGNNVDSNTFRKTLGILNIYKDSEREWEIRMLGAKNSPYEEGVYTITINFPQNFPNKGPEVSLKNKIYHLQINPTSGRIDAAFLLTWDKKTSIAELLVGLYLSFIFEQNPNLPYDGEKARVYISSKAKFNKFAREWAAQYASPTINDLKLINNMKFGDLENKYNLLIDQVKKLENDLSFNKNITMQLLKELQSNHQNGVIPGGQLMSVIFQTMNSDINCSINCKDTDIFVNVECLFYKKYPQYLESEQYFITNGRKVNKYKTLKENGIKDKDIIVLNNVNQSMNNF